MAAQQVASMYKNDGIVKKYSEDLTRSKSAPLHLGVRFLAIGNRVSCATTRMSYSILLPNLV